MLFLHCLLLRLARMQVEHRLTHHQCHFTSMCSMECRRWCTVSDRRSRWSEIAGYCQARAANVIKGNETDGAADIFLLALITACRSV
jgi:hypothetical protein